MSDILIRGMEMPKEGGKILIAADGSVWVNAWPTRGYMRMENVYAVPLPEGHGRLIDADELMVKIKVESDFIEANFIRGRDKVSLALAVKQELSRVMEIVEKMPTIKKKVENG